MRCVVLGGGALPLCAGLARAGWDVSVRAEDDFEAQRLSDILGRLDVHVPVHRAAQTADLVIEAGFLQEDVDEGRVIATSPEIKGLPGLQLLPFGNLIELRDAGPKGRAIAAALRSPFVESKGSGFAFTRIMTAWLTQADVLLLDGAPPSEIDEAVTDAGLRIGPYELDDLIGVSRLPPGVARARAIAEGRLGQAMGWGWYRYPGGGGKVTDPLIEDLVTEEARFLGHRQRDVPEEEIAQTLLSALQNAFQSETAVGHMSKNDVATLAHVVFGLEPMAG